MSKLTLDEAIKHCLEVAEENDLAAGTYEILAENNHNAYERLTAETNSSRCAECAADHRQLAEWLMKLKDLRAEQNDQYAFIRELMDELEEAKRLLKAAVDDFAVYGALKDLSTEQRVKNPDWRRFNRVFDILDHQWRYADEALKLIGGSENG